MEEKKFSEVYIKPKFNNYEQVKILPNQALYVKYGILEGEKGDVNMPAAMHVFGTVDVELLNRSINLMIEHYDVFRATLVEEEDGYYFCFLKEYCYEIEVIDTVGVTKEERFADAYKKAYDFNGIHMELWGSPLWRMKLYKINDDEYLFLINMHHVIMDGTTEVMAIVILNKYYEMLQKGIIPPFPTEMSYKEFIEKEYEYAETEEGKKHIEYYDNLMEGYKKPDLAPFGGNTSVNLAEKPFLLNNDMLNRFFTKYKTSKFNAYMMCYQLALHKILGTDDISVAMSSANRMAKESRGTIGRVSRFVPNRFIIEADKTMVQLLKQENDIINDAMKHQKLSTYNDIIFDVSYSSGIGNNSAPVFLGHKAQSLSLLNQREVPLLFIVAYDREPGILSFFIGGSKTFDPVKVDICKMYIRQAFYKLLNDSETTFSELVSSPMLIDASCKGISEEQILRLDMGTCSDEFAVMLRECSVSIERCDGRECDTSAISIVFEESGNDAVLKLTGTDTLLNGNYDIYVMKDKRKWLIDSVAIS